MKISLARCVVIAALLPLGGCGRDLISLATAPPGLVSNSDFPRCLARHGVIAEPAGTAKNDFVAVDAALLAELYRRPLPLVSYDDEHGFVPAQTSALSGYLDCLLGEANDANASAQLLRGHIMLTLMTQYGAELVRASRSDRQPAQALRVISHVREAELLLVAGSAALAPPAAVGPQLGQFWVAARIASILQVAIDIETVYLRRSLDLASNLLAAIGGGPGALGQVKTLVARAGDGLVLTQRSQLYGAAFVADARSSLAAVGASGPTSKNADVVTQWGLWSARMDAACADLAALAKLSDPSCRPTTAAVARLRAGMGGVNPLREAAPTAAAPGG